MSGLEVLGVVTGVIPICLEIWDRTKGPAGTLRSAASTMQHSRALDDLYEELLFETYKLKSYLKRIVNNLGGVSEDERQRLLQSISQGRDPDVWSSDSRIDQALVDFFGGKTEMETIRILLRKVLKLLAILVEDQSVHLSKYHQSQQKMYEKLKEFRRDWENGRKASKFRERYNFFKKKDIRAVCLKDFKKKNKCFGDIVDGICADHQRHAVMQVSRAGHSTSSSIASAATSPTTDLRNLTKRLFTALFKCWACNCSFQHEARFCLSKCAEIVASKNEQLHWEPCAGVSFDFLLQLELQSGHAVFSELHEASVQINSVKSLKAVASRNEMKMICERKNLFGSRKTMQLRVIIEDDGTPNQRVWGKPQIPKEPKSRYEEDASIISFDQYLRSYPKPTLLQRRKLALLLAYSLFQLHESPWQSSQWDKKHIQFVQHREPNNTGKFIELVDVEHPYLSTTFSTFTQDAEDKNEEIWHQNPGVLKLAILLVEVHLWRPIEDLREAGDYGVDGEVNGNTDMFTAARMVSTAFMDDKSDYKDLVRGCLDMEWITGSQLVTTSGTGGSSLVEEVWDGVYRHVILPLEREIALGTK